MKIDTLDALSPLDGRYRKKVKELASVFSERGLMARRTQVETTYLLALSDHSGVPLRELTGPECAFLRSLNRVSLKDAGIIKRIELKGYRGRPKTNHDVKAVEYRLRYRFAMTSLRDVVEWIHFALTSEDVNNIAYALQLREGILKHLLPALEGVHANIQDLAQKYASVAMLARTHGQPASPTTFGKEMRVFASRENRELAELREFRIQVKLNGASGNYHAHTVALPNVDWVEFSEKFVEGFNSRKHAVLFEPNLITTQVEPHDTYAKLFDLLKRIAVILSSFCEDMWRYVSDDWVKQKAVLGEVGSSVMPHKVNPINFENAEGNLNFAISQCEFYARQLPRMRLQRHLSDSTVIRNFGVTFGHLLLACKEIQTGLGKIAPDSRAMKKALMERPEVIAEAFQTILRREGLADPYKQLSELTRGKHVSLKELRAFVRGLNLTPSVEKELLALSPSNYTGLAGALAVSLRSS